MNVYFLFSFLCVGVCVCACVLRRNSRWPPKMEGKQFLGKVASGLCRYPVGQKFGQNHYLTPFLK